MNIEKMRSKVDSRVLTFSKKANELKKINPKEALRLAEEALKIEPENSFILGIKIQCLLKLKQNQKAVEIAEKIIKLNSSPTAHGLLTQAYLANGQNQKAVEIAEKIIKLDSSSTAHGHLTQAYLANGQNQKAVEIAEKRIKLDPSSTAHGLLTQAYLATGQNQKAVEIAEKLTGSVAKGDSTYFF